MPKVIYGGQSYECGDQSVLDCLTAQGINIPSACHSGICQTCMIQAVSGNIPQRAQAGLKDTLAAQKYFLPCVCHPEEDIEVALYGKGQLKFQAQVTCIEFLNADILGIRIKPARPFEYKAGQFISLFKDEATARCYSLASVPELDDELFINVRKVPNGQMTGWIFDTVRTGDTVTISGASGDCFYVPGKPEQNILLIGTGSGLAPLYGIIRDAIRNGHTGCISLYHGSLNTAGFYLVDALRELAREHPNFKYVPCVSEGNASQDYATGMVAEVALQNNPVLSGWRVYLCGNPDMVKSAQQKTFLAGASLREIFADPF